MKSIRFTVICCVAFALSSCEAPKPEDCILGRWEDKDHNPLDFRRDGTVVGKFQVGKIIFDLDGRYRFLDETTLELETASTLLPKGVATFKINRLDYRELSLTSTNGIMTMWTRPAN